MKKMKWYGYALALFVLFMYAMGTYDFFMMLSHNAAYYADHNYGQEVVEYFTNYPFYFMIFWIINLICGVVSPLLLLVKNRYAEKAALVSLSADLILILLTSVFRNRIGVLGFGTFAFDIFIVVLTLLLYLYCKSLIRK